MTSSPFYGPPSLILVIPLHRAVSNPKRAKMPPGCQDEESGPSRIHGLGEGWYFTRSQIDRSSPSRIHGIDAEQENRLSQSYCSFIKGLGVELGLSQVTIATSTILCHRLYLRQSHSSNDRCTIAASCLLLANKLSDERVKMLEELALKTIHENGEAGTAKLEQMQQIILKGEHLVLRTLNFDLEIETPYKHLASAFKKFKADQWHSKFAQVAWNFVNDGLMTTVCLQFKPRQVAGAAFYLATRWLRVKLPLDPENPWFLEFDMSIPQLEDICCQRLEFYGP